MALPLAVYAISSRAAAPDPAMAPQDYATQYRALSNIVWSCITTILLCTWVSYHPDVPEPVNMNGFGRWKKIKKHSWRFIEDRLFRFFWVLLVPEWILSESLEEFFKARSLAKMHGLSLNQAFFLRMGGFHRFERTTRADGATPAFSISNEAESVPLVKEDDEIPRGSLDWSDVVALQNAGKLQIPRPKEIQDKSKNDWVAKSLVLIQTSWFIAQCIGRRAQQLPLTELEVVTLGYTVVNVAIYAVWWKKPYQVAEPVRVYDVPPQERKNLGKLDEGYNANNLSLFGMGAIFGALHFIAWASSFPTPVEKMCWRISAIVLTAIPVFLGSLWLLGELFRPFSRLPNSVFVIPSLPYPIARVVTLVLAFTTLRNLPPDVYRNVEWSNFLPHI